MTAEAQETSTLHGGRLVARRLKAYGVSKLFTLSGGHLFSIYDGCRAEGIDIVDTRHEAAATFAATAGATAEIPGLIDDAWRVMRREHPGPAFLDFPLDVVFMEADEPPVPGDPAMSWRAANGAAVERAAALLQEAERPVIMAGTNLYWGRGEDALRELAETAGIPVFLNGLARGCLPADHPRFFSRARSTALKGADVALVVGVPMDFRLGFGGSFGEETEIVAIDLAEPARDHPRAVAAECYGNVSETLRALAGAAGGASTAEWLAAPPG